MIVLSLDTLPNLVILERISKHVQTKPCSLFRGNLEEHGSCFHETYSLYKQVNIKDRGQ